MTREEAFGVRIQHLREELGLSLRKAALKIGLSHLRLSELEAGRSKGSQRPTRAKPELVANIASAYGVPRDSLLELAGYAKENPDLAPDEQLIVELLRQLDGVHRKLAVALVATVDKVIRGHKELKEDG